jgi:hypothetical protein
MIAVAAPQAAAWAPTGPGSTDRERIDADGHARRPSNRKLRRAHEELK